MNRQGRGTRGEGRGEPRSGAGDARRRAEGRPLVTRPARLVPVLLLLLAACEHRPKPCSDFDGQTAYGYIKTQLAFGPRIPGTEGHRKTGDWIVAQMRQRAATVTEQRWTHRTAKGDTLPLRNILARYRPEASERILYVTHWDTRPVSDAPGVPESQRNIPVPGADDGASGVALFLGLGDLFKKTPPPVGVDLLFVDGEDYGTFGPPDVDVLIGSTYFADHLPSPDYKPLFGVLWDMIGDADLRIPQEQNSIDQAPEVVQRVWAQARECHLENIFVPDDYGAITDDHVPLLKKGLHVIDVIDLDYPAHHTPEDNLSKVSAASMKAVGDLAAAVIYRFGK